MYVMKEKARKNHYLLGAFREVIGWTEIDE